MLSDIAFVVGVVLLAAILVVLLLIYRNPGTIRGGTRQAPENDLAHMMILLQTMRDLLREQKQLARDINRSVDRKVTMVKAMVREAMDETERVKRTMQALHRTPPRPEKSSAPSSYVLDDEHDEADLPPQTPQPDRKARLASYIEEARREGLANPTAESLDPPIQIISDVADEREGDESLIDNWVGLDFGDDVPDPAPSYEPGSNRLEGGAEARAAFRSLLDFDERPPRDGAAFDGPDNRGNGAGGRSAVEKRVYSYSDAGMSVGEIARELGIGKGEVRLMLNLRDQEGNG